MSPRDLAKARPSTDEKGRRKDAALRARRLAERKGDMPVADIEVVEAPRTERVVDAELLSPSPKGGVIGVLQQPYLLRLLVRRQLAQQYAASLLGLLWSYIQPAIRFAVYYLVFGVFLNLHDDVPNFPIHLFVGIVFVHYFTETLNGGVRSIWNNKALVKKMAMPREIFPVSQMIVAIYHTFPQVVLLVVICLFSGMSVSWTSTAALLLGMAILIVFSTACALLLSALNVYYRDFQNIVGTITQMMHFLVPMMYPFGRILGYQDSHPVLYQLYMGNPVAQSVILLQQFFWEGVNKAAGPDAFTRAQNASRVMPEHLFTRGLITLAVCFVLLWLAQKAFSRLEYKFPERI